MTSLAALHPTSVLVPRARGRRVRIGGTGLLLRRNPHRDVHVRRADAERREPVVRRAWPRRSTTSAGQTVVFFVLVVAAAEVVVGLAIIVAILRRKADATADDLALMKG